MTTVGIPARKIGTPTGVPGDFSLGVGTFGYGYLSPAMPTYYTLNFNFDTDQHLLSPNTPEVYNSTSLDISKFINYGHKIIWYHGLSDPGPPVTGTLLYYNGLAAQNGGLQAIQSFSRLYPVPNMDHCTGGATTDQFDMLTPIVQWVENGTAPTSVPATGTNFTAAVYQVGFVTGAPDNAPTTRSRVLCPYPQEARFTGSTTMVNGVPVATTPADLANGANYSCITVSPPFLE
jgi:feruloyl esterase